MPRLSGSRWSTTAVAARYLESAYSAHVNITPTALLPVDQGKRLCVVSIMSARHKVSCAIQPSGQHKPLCESTQYPPGLALLLGRNASTSPMTAQE